MPSIVNDRTAPARRVLGFELIRADETTHIAHNRAVHRMLVDGVAVEYRGADGSIAGAQARVIDFDVPANNDWLAVNQFTVAEGQHTRRPDVVLFVNGLPLASGGPTTVTQWPDKLRWRRRLIGASGRWGRPSSSTTIHPALHRAACDRVVFDRATTRVTGTSGQVWAGSRHESISFCLTESRNGDTRARRRFRKGAASVPVQPPGSRSSSFAAPILPESRSAASRQDSRRLFTGAYFRVMARAWQPDFAGVNGHRLKIAGNPSQTAVCHDRQAHDVVCGPKPSV